MYRVIQQKKVIALCVTFVDAWLYVYLELPSFAHIKGPDGESWTINPHGVN